MAARTFLGNLRLLLLLAVLGFVALGAWLDRARARDWDSSLRVTVYPLAAGGSESAAFVEGIDDSAYQDIERFLAGEARRFSLPLEEPVRIRVSRHAAGLPPASPDEPGMISLAAWSLRMRYWAWRVQADDPLPPPDVQVFALYHDFREHHALPDSLGLSKGLMVVAQLFAANSAAGSNNVVLAHELLHTLGATDKYDPRSGQPRVPQGLGDPDARPLYPQRRGEIMAGRIAVGPNEAAIPDRLEQMNVGELTAGEIGWLE
jgi:hypothetical protein